MKANLVNIDSLWENLFVFSLDPVNDIWIGYTDQAKEGHWVWTEKGSANTFTNWASRPPDNFQNQDCAMIWRWIKTLRWDDRHCRDPYHYVCERGRLCLLCQSVAVFMW